MSSNQVITRKNQAFRSRFIETCGTSQPAEISRLLNISYQAAKNYIEGRMPEPNVLIEIADKTPYSIHWLLTGKGEKFVEPASLKDTLLVTDQLRAFIKGECQKVVGEILGVSGGDAQEKVIVLKSKDIKDEKKIA